MVDKLKNNSFKLSAPIGGYFFVITVLSFFILLGIILAIIFFTILLVEDEIINYYIPLWSGIFIIIPILIIRVVHGKYSWKRILNVRNNYLEFLDEKKPDKTIRVSKQDCDFSFYDKIVRDSESVTDTYFGPLLGIKSDGFKIAIVTRAKVHWKLSKGEYNGSFGAYYSLPFDEWIRLLEELNLKNRLE